MAEASSKAQWAALPRTRASKYTINVAKFILVVQLAELFGPIGVLANLGALRPLTVTLMIASFACVAIDAQRTYNLLRIPIVRHWLYVIWIAPTGLLTLQLLLGISSQEDFIYYVSFISSFGALYLLSIHTIVHLDNKEISTLILVSAIFACLGFALNYVDFSFIRRVLALRESEIASYSGLTRILGFYPHPNVAGFSTLLYVLVATTLLIPAKRQFALTLCLAYLFAILIMTGSRTSLALGAILVLAVFYRAIFSAARQIGRPIVVFFIIFIFVGGVSTALVPLAEGDGPIALGLQRMSSITSIFAGDGIADDRSASERLSVLPRYLAYSMQSPFLGFGPAESSRLIETGVFQDVSQNLWVQWGLEYGYLYSFYCAAVILWTATIAWRARRQRDLRNASFSALVFLTLIITASFSINTMFLQRTVVIVTAIVVGALVRDRIASQHARLGAESHD